MFLIPIFASTNKKMLQAFLKGVMENRTMLFQYCKNTNSQ
jgi:membrane protein CcdC involved in cytochrome C biogenesis